MKIKKGFAMRSVMGQNVVMAEGDHAEIYDKILVLTPSAAMLWEMAVAGRFTPESATDFLVDTFEVTPAQARADVDAFVARLASNGLIE